MSNSTVGDAAIAVVRRNTEEVQGKATLYPPASEIVEQSDGGLGRRVLEIMHGLAGLSRSGAPVRTRAFAAKARVADVDGAITQMRRGCS